MEDREVWVLYDIPTKHGAKCWYVWSPNVWKARAMLNAKGIIYHTIWVEYPDIRNVLPQFGLPPLDGDPPYTLPMLRVEKRSKTGERSTECLRDSVDIIKYVNKRYPEPVIDLDGPINAAFAESKHAPGPAFAGLCIPAVADRLAEPSAVYFRATRKQYFGCSLEEYRQRRLKEGVWQQMEDWVTETRALLRKKGGPFFLGEKLSLLDIRLVGLLKWMEVGGEPEDFSRVMKMGGDEFARFWEAAGPVYFKKHE